MAPTDGDYMPHRTYLQAAAETRRVPLPKTPSRVLPAALRPARTWPGHPDEARCRARHRCGKHVPPVSIARPSDPSSRARPKKTSPSDSKSQCSSAASRAYVCERAIGSSGRFSLRLWTGLRNCQTGGWKWAIRTNCVLGALARTWQRITTAFPGRRMDRAGRVLAWIEVLESAPTIVPNRLWNRRRSRKSCFLGPGAGRSLSVARRTQTTRPYGLGRRQLLPTERSRQDRHR